MVNGVLSFQTTVKKCMRTDKKICFPSPLYEHAVMQGQAGTVNTRPVAACESVCKLQLLHEQHPAPRRCEFSHCCMPKCRANCACGSEVSWQGDFCKRHAGFAACLRSNSICPFVLVRDTPANAQWYLRTTVCAVRFVAWCGFARVRLDVIQGWSLRVMPLACADVPTCLLLSM